MGKERMKMQENMNPAPEGAQTPADEEAAREAARLSQLKADMLVLIDTVADSSRDVKLIDGDTLFERFAKRASVAEAPEVDELVREAEADIDAVLGRTDGVSANVVKFRSKSEMKAHADEVATQKAQRRVFSRREVIQNLLAGNVASVVKAAEAADAKTEPEGEAREITREYFDEVLSRVLEGDYGVCSLESWDKVTYYHYRPLLSCSYARILSAENNPVEQVVDMIRESSCVYPRPVAIGVFEEPPFGIEAEELQEMLKMIAQDPEKQDIRFTTSSIGTVFLYSNKYLEDGYAEFLAEEQDVGAVMNP